MTIALSRSFSAVAVNITSSFLATGGKRPYTYSVLPGGAGGTIVARTGIYTAPPVATSDPNTMYDTIQVVDALSATTTSRILIGTPLMLFCDIIQQGMGLADGRVYVWDQKLFQPSDYDLYIAISVPSCKPFGNNNSASVNTAGTYVQQQSVNMLARLDIDIISRGPAARDRKEQVILALDSNYSNQQQQANSFFIGRISTNFINLSNIDGAAIPYRYNITCQMQYAVGSSSAIPYFNQFPGYSLTTN